MVELTEGAGGKTLDIEQIGHQDAHLAVGGDVADETHLLRFAGAFVIISVALANICRSPHSSILCNEAASISWAPGRNRPSKIWPGSAARLI